MPLTSIFLKGCQVGSFKFSSHDEHNLADISCHSSPEYFCKQKSRNGFGSNSPILLIPSWDRPLNISRKLYTENQGEVKLFYTPCICYYIMYIGCTKRVLNVADQLQNVIAVWQITEGWNLTFTDSWRASCSSCLYWCSLTTKEL